MPSVADRLDEIEQHVMDGLKDFQQATVNRIAQLYNDGQKRVLVSDEVGLGKTLIARGTIAKFASIRKSKNDNLVKVVYICSNSSIADQNLEKLEIADGVRRDNASYSRLSMQHLNIFNQENDKEILDGYIQLIPLTPNTSFKMDSSAGIVSERALMFVHLKRIEALKSYRKQLEVLLTNNAYGSWNSEKNYYENSIKECNKKSNKDYLPYMEKELTASLNKKQNNGKTLLEELIDKCIEIKANKNKRISSNSLILKLRIMFAQISLNKLEPDLIIMDEFQRFKSLLEAEDDTDIGILKNRFFNSNDVCMLLLSATPYKMYSTLEEIDETQTDEHFKEFLKVMDFLNANDDSSSFRTIWENYSIKLKEITKGTATVISAKNNAEAAMYQHVCRTERISATEGADMIDSSDVEKPLSVSEKDIKSYLDASQLLDEMKVSFGVPIDYIKSTPYVMSYMRHYKFKEKIEKHFVETDDDVSKANKSTLWLNKRTISGYNKLPCNNARLERVMAHTFKNNAEGLLWVPPSKPYYEFGGVYKGAEDFSKTLIFSSWEMVPRMLATTLSYEAERRTTGKLAKMGNDKDAKYFHADNKRYPAALLNFNVKEGKPSAMNLLSLFYPSRFLAECFSPIECLNRGLSLKQIENEIAAKISEQLDKFDAPDNGAIDNRWYYLSPLLLDSKRYKKYINKWLDAQKSLLESNKEKDSNMSNALKEHLKQLSTLYAQTQHGKIGELGRKPNDLVEVLTNLAIASPSICVYRTYKTYSNSFACELPSQIAKAFINRMNSPEATAVIKLLSGDSNIPQWKALLNYCKNGNIQAMLDEYAHLLSSGFDGNKNIISKLHSNLEDAMRMRSTTYNVDTYKSFSSRVMSARSKRNGDDTNEKKGNDGSFSIRSHFAVAFTKGDGNEKDTDRKKSLRDAFNSPFRPFVLASTSIGQEGLDFHNYCRRIVHWNLPTNPIDIEQREGRINRFECLAIRQNIAKRYGNIEFKSNIWQDMFDEAVIKEKAVGENISDLIPFWSLTERDDMVRIERVVPMYPFSKDRELYERLIKILSLYRLALGQPRQEEFLEYIIKNSDNTDDFKELFINLSPYYKENN